MGACPSLTVMFFPILTSECQILLSDDAILHDSSSEPWHVIPFY
jgi:hypothetical protein